MQHDQRVENFSGPTTYGEALELEGLPAHIESLEAAVDMERQRVGDPPLYQADGTTIQAAMADLEAAEAELAQAYERWEWLEARRDA